MIPTFGRFRRDFAGLAALAALASAGCGGCGAGGVSDAAGLLATDPAAVDFGFVVVGQQAERRVLLRNDGRGPLLVRTVERADGLPDTLRFSPRSVALEPGAEAVLTVVFEPVDEGAVSGSLVLRTDGAPAELSLPVRGTGTRPRLALAPASLDFGPVVAGEPAAAIVTVTNEGDAPVDVIADAPSGPDAALFRSGFAGETGRPTRLEPGAAAALHVTFRPTSVGEAEAEVAVRACPACVPIVAAVRGRGVAAGLVPEPARLDFGAVLPGDRARRGLVFRNLGDRAVTLVGVRLAETGTEFEVEPPASWPVIAPAGTFELTIAYAPTALGPDDARLAVTTDDPRTPAFTVPIRGYGGGPAVRLAPATLAFGTVGLQYPISRRLVVRNEGLNDTATDLDVLLVTAARIEGAAAFTWKAADGQSLPLAVDAGARVVLDVRYAPAVAGPDAAELVLETNDPARPLLRVPLSGTGAAVFPCDYALLPAASPGLQFGLVSRGRPARLALHVRNAGPTDCVVGKVELTPDTPAAFTLPGGAIYGRVVAPGAVLPIEVALTAPAETPDGTELAGLVDVQLSSDQAPRQVVALSGRVASSCLSITPPGAVFGNVSPGCATIARTFTVHNACEGDVTVTALEQRLGRDTFALVAPGLPVTLGPAGELHFDARYAPPDRPGAPELGPHFGTVELFTNQPLTGSRPYVVTLEGRSELGPEMVDEFVQAERASADVLFVVDDSSSMSEEQETLAREFGSFMEFAITEGLDYRLAVTTTGTCGTSSPRGRFVPLDGPHRIVTPLLPDPEQTFRDNVDVGTGGCSGETGLHAAWLALTDPNVNGPNAGFLRSDAMLSVVVVSDEDDVSPSPVDFYVEFLKGLKGPGGANLVTFGAIIGNRSGGCRGPGGHATYGASYVTAAERLNGLTASICDANWSTALRHLGLNAFGFRSRFLLTGHAEPGSVEVTVDDVVVPAGTFWTYSSEVNAVDFEPTAIPPAGARIRVAYDVACR